MTTIYALISLLTVLAAALFSARMLRTHTRVAFLLAFTIIFSTVIVLQAYLLSAISKLNDTAWWALAGVVTCALTCAPLLVSPALRAVCLRKPVVPRDIEQRIKAVEKREFTIRLLLMMAVTVGIVSLINFVQVAMLEPATPDVHQYHLARMVYYLQQGNLNYFDAGYWAQVVYPKVATILHLYAYLASGNFAGLTQLVQFIAYFAGMLALYGICRHLGQGRRASAFAGLTFGLLIICIVEATTAQNDLILTALIGAAIYFLLAYREWRSVKYLVLAAVAFALAAGVKATFLVTVPSLAIIAAFALFRRPLAPRHLGAGVLALALAGMLLTLPSGYWDNARRFGDPFGPREVRAKYTQEHKPLPAMLADGMLNVLRYGVDTLTLEGWYPVPYALQAQRWLTGIPQTLFTRLNLDLEAKRGARLNFPFSYRKYVRADETFSSWGMLGFLLVWPVVWLALLRKRFPASTRLFAAAAVVYYLVLCIIVPYDPFHGRFLITGALFALPPLAAFMAMPHGRIGRTYLTAVVALGCVNALIAASFRTGTSLIPHTDYEGRRVPSVFRLTRTELLMREAPLFDLLLFETYVPQDAVVAVDVRRILPYYIFFGESYSRRLISLRPFYGERKELPEEAQFILYDVASPHYHPDGKPLNRANSLFGVIYLRELRPSPSSGTR